MKLSKEMLKSRKPKMTSGPGEAWFYVSPNGLEVCVAEAKGMASIHCFTITRNQIYRAMQIIRVAKNNK